MHGTFFCDFPGFPVLVGTLVTEDSDQPGAQGSCYTTLSAWRKLKVLYIVIKCPCNDPDQPVPLNVVLTNGQFILPRCGTLMFTTALLRLLTK